MTVEYLVLGVVVLLMGVGQIYFRHFAGGDDPETPGRRQVPTRSGRPARPVLGGLDRHPGIHRRGARHRADRPRHPRPLSGGLPG